MKQTSDFKMFLIFFVVLVILFWVIPDQKIDTIGDFFKKIITPIAVPLSISLGAKIGIAEYKKIKKNKRKRYP